MKLIHGGSPLAAARVRSHVKAKVNSRVNNAKVGPSGDIGFEPVSDNADILGGGKHGPEDDLTLVGLERGSGDFFKSFENAAERSEDLNVAENNAQIVRAGAA